MDEITDRINDDPDASIRETLGRYDIDLGSPELQELINGMCLGSKEANAGRFAAILGAFVLGLEYASVYFDKQKVDLD